MRSRTLAVVAVSIAAGALGIAGVSAGSQAKRSSAPPRADPHHVEWVAGALRRMQSVKPGMTRHDLLAVFTVEGGLSTPVRQTYVDRECPYFKVDVDFKPVGRPARDAAGRVAPEAPSDVITGISKPYVAWSIAD